LNYFLKETLFLTLVIFLSSCAPINEKIATEVAGFWTDLWHGFISFFTFIISLFNDNVSIYKLNNTVKPYNLGFILGIAFYYGGGSKSCYRKKC